MIHFIVVYNYKLFFYECFMILLYFLKVTVISVVVPFLLWKSVYIKKFSTRADSLRCKMIMENDITILFSNLVSLIVPLQTWNVK